VPDLQTPASPIGVFDSGVGGISVLKAIRRRLPNETLLYIADSANAPYGERDSSFIRERAFKLAEFLCESDAKAIVVACNTATVVAVEALRSGFKPPIIALEPAIKPAVALTRTGVVAVLATSRTLESGPVARLCHRYGGNARVILRPCPGLVELVERGELASERTMLLLESYIRPVLAAGADTIVLGCTHYPFLENQIRAIAGPAVAILDSAEAVARQVERRTRQVRSGAPSTRPKDAFFTTGDPGPARVLISKLWGAAVDVQALPVHSARGQA
jgi:glutamate racemase